MARLSTSPEDQTVVRTSLEALVGEIAPGLDRTGTLLHEQLVHCHCRALAASVAPKPQPTMVVSKDWHRSSEKQTTELTHVVGGTSGCLGLHADTLEACRGSIMEDVEVARRTHGGRRRS